MARRPAELNDPDRDVLHFPVAEKQRREDRAEYELWRQACTESQPWWVQGLIYLGCFGAGALVSAYLTWMFS